MARYTSKAMKEGAAVMRGPMASNTMHQLIAFTDWGYLDYLIIDMPPGTSDIHLTLGQEVTMDGMFLPQTIPLIPIITQLMVYVSRHLRWPDAPNICSKRNGNCVTNVAHFLFWRPSWETAHGQNAILGFFI